MIGLPVTESIVAAAPAPLHPSAAVLAEVYRSLLRNGDVPLGAWAIPRRDLDGSADVNHRLMNALRTSYGPDGALKVYQVYKQAFDTVIPAVQKAASQAASVELARQSRDLTALARLLAEGNIPMRLHSLAADVKRRAGGYYLTAEDYGHAAPMAPQMVDAASIRRRDRVTAAFRAGLQALPEGLDAREHRASVDFADLARALWIQPDGLSIFDAYASSQTEGTAASLRRVGDAMRATDDFAAELRKTSDHVWRYPPLIALGLNQSKLADVPSFLYYAVDLGPALDPQPIAAALNALGLLVACVGILLGPGGVAVGVAILDVGLTGTSTVLTYLREREQNLAEVSSRFRAAGAIAPPADFSETMFAGAAGLISALQLLRPAASLVRSVKARVAGAAPVEAGLELAPKGVVPAFETQSELEKTASRSGARPDLTQRSITLRQRATKGTSRVGKMAEELGTQRLTARAKSAAAEPLTLGAGAPREIDPVTLGEARGLHGGSSKAPSKPGGIDPLDFNAIPEERLRVETNASAVEASHPTSNTVDPSKPVASDSYLAGLERANKQGRKSRGAIVTRDEQLHGILPDPAPLSQGTRVAPWRKRLPGPTPSEELQEWARSMLAKGDPDPILPMLKVDKATADHIVAVELVRQFPGFAQLSPEDMLKVLNMSENFMPVSNAVNQARNSRPYSMLAGVRLLGNEIPPPILAAMIQRENNLTTLIQERINELLRARAAGRQVPFILPKQALSLPGLWRAQALDSTSNPD